MFSWIIHQPLPLCLKRNILPCPYRSPPECTCAGITEAPPLLTAPLKAGRLQPEICSETFRPDFYCFLRPPTPTAGQSFHRSHCAVHWAPLPKWLDEMRCDAGDCWTSKASMACHAIPCCAMLCCVAPCLRGHHQHQHHLSTRLRCVNNESAERMLLLRDTAEEAH